MTTFLGILFILLFFNALLIGFSVARSRKKLPKPLQRIGTQVKDTEIPELLPKDYSNTELKKAV